MRYIKFDKDLFNFNTVISGIMNHSDLQTLHLADTEKHEKLFEVGKDSSTIFHKIFYDKYRSGWDYMNTLYEAFIQAVVAPRYPEDFLYQKFPTFRVHLPGNLAVGAFHNDGEFHHPSGEVNYIIPLTESKESASVWVETEPGKKDFIPMRLSVGELIEFNGNKLTHGNKVNVTGKTRVSMDFRVLPLSCYMPTEEGSMTLGTKFKEGEYYKRFTK